MPLQNRLKLNWDITDRGERVTFASNYLESLTFTLNTYEVETLANYILWGKNSEGLNGRQEGLELETRYKTWDVSRIESLDALTEDPAFNEATVRQTSLVLLPKNQKPQFSRSEVRRTASPDLLPIFEDLWRRIDTLELKLGFYDLAHAKRKTPLREELLKRFEATDLAAAEEAARHISTYKYVKMKHELVELRREQYTLRDTFAQALLPAQEFFYNPEPDAAALGEEIDVRPLGIPNENSLARKLWGDEFPYPAQFSPSELKAISSLLWKKPAPSKRYFDFGNEDHLYTLFGMWGELEEAASRPNIAPDSTLPAFLNALKTYKKLAQLEPFLEDILDLKVKKKSNQDIVDFLKEKYGKTYTPNYISTLYCKKCLAQIAAAAKFHREVVGNLFFPENFKQCKDCGKVLLLSSENFVKRARSSDGFSPRCKQCEKKLRARAKEEKSK